MSAPPAGGAPPPARAPLPAQRALEAGLAGLVVLLALWMWLGSVRGAAAPDAPGLDTMSQLEALRAEGRGGLPLALMGLVAAAALAALARALGRALRAVRVALPPGAALSPASLVAVAGAWWGERTAPLARETAGRVTIGHFLLAFGAVHLAQAPALLLMPPARLEVDGTPVEVTATSPHTVAPVGTAGAAGGVTARFIPSLGQVAVRVSGGPVHVDGVTRGPGRWTLRDGALVDVAGVRVVARAPSALGQVAASAAAQALSVLVLVGGVLVLGGRGTLARLGLTSRGLPHELRRGALAFLALLPAYFAVVALWSALGQALGLPPQGHALIEMLEREGPRLAPLILLQAVLLAPLQEELLYRGLLVPALTRVLGALAGVLASALVFAAVHPGFLSLAPLLTLGALFAGLFATSTHGSLVGSITAHALYNGITLLLVLSVQLA